MKGGFAGEAGAGGGGSPIFFDVLDHQIGAAEMVYEGAHLRAIHRVGEVAHEQDVFSESDKLADGKGTTEHAHVRMHTHDHDVVDAALLKQVIDFLTFVANRVLGRDFDGCDLPLPRIGRAALAA